jgi:hypothetical protein
LRIGRQIAVQGDEFEPRRIAQRRGPLHGAPDLRGPWKKDEQVARRSALQELADRARDLRFERTLVGFARVRHRNFVLTPRARDHGRPEERRYRRRIERRRHHDEHEIGTPGLAQVRQKSERHVALQMSLVKFIQDDRPHAAELGIGDEAAREDPFGDELDPRGRRNDALEAHLVPHRLPYPLAAFLRDAPGSEPSREAARLEHHDLPFHAGVEQRRRHPRRFASPRGRLQDQCPRRPRSLDDFGQHGVDG